MSLLEIEFLFFLPLVWIAYWAGPRKADWQNGCLLAASVLFYAGWSWRMLALLLASTLIDYRASLVMASLPATAAHRRRRLAAFWLSAGAAIAALAYFKYVNFFLTSFAALLRLAGFEPSLPVLQLVLPLGISFLTLQRLSYLVDVYFERQPACRSLLEYAVFVTFFPQVTAGPISRGSQLLPQLAEARRLTPALLGSAAGTYIIGYLMKGGVADWLGEKVVDPVFANQAAYSTAAHWTALFGYGLQVFADFAGYSLLAIGTARAFGIELPMNFNAPFLSRSLAEFWGRWHITLNRWLFDYIYGPLTTSHGWFRGRLDLTLIVVFAISGLWHGAAWGFVFWGILHGVGMVVHRRWDEFYRGLCRKDRAYVARRQAPAYSLAAWAATQLFFVVCLLPFRATSTASLLEFLKALVSSQAGLAPDPGPLFGIITAAGVAFIVVSHVAQMPSMAPLRERAARVPWPVLGVACGLAVLWLAVFMPASGGTFIYRQF